MAILFASCLEEVGYHPILQFGEGHALAGLFINDIEDENNEISSISFENGVEKREEVLRNLVGNKIIIIDTVSITANNNTSFQQAINNGYEYVMRHSGNEFMAIDIYTRGRQGIRPEGRLHRLRSRRQHRRLPQGRRRHDRPGPLIERLKVKRLLNQPHDRA